MVRNKFYNYSILYLIMKHILIVLLMLFTQSVLSQSIGYEMRTNDKSYIAITYKGIELRHRTDDLENRFT